MFTKEFAIQCERLVLMVQGSKYNVYIQHVMEHPYEERHSKCSPMVAKGGLAMLPGENEGVSSER